MAREVPASLVCCGQWNHATPAFDPNFLVINDCRFGSDASDIIHWTFCRNGQDVSGDDQGTTANFTTSGTKWGLPQMVDLSSVGNNRWVTRDFGGSFARPTDLRIMSMAVWVKPTYSGTPASPVAFGGPGCQSWSGGTYNAGTLYHDSADGKLKYIQYGSSHGTYIGITASSSAWSPTAGEWSLLEISFDYLNGAQYLFINGTLVGTSSYTGSISGTCRDYWIIGAANPSSFTPTGLVTSHYMQEMVIYDGLWHTASYTVDDRPWLEKLQDVGMPFTLAYARDLAAGDEYTLTPLPRGNSLHLNCGIDTTTPKFDGSLHCINPPNRFPALRYSGNGIVSGLGNVGTVEFWVRLNTSPSYADEQQMFDIRMYDPWSSDGANRIYIMVNLAGNLYGHVNASGTTILAADLTSSPLLTTGVWHHVQFSWQGYGNGFVPCSGGCHFWCFVDGVKTHDSTGSYWGNTRGTGAQSLSVGNDMTASRSYAAFTLDELCFYDTILNTSDFTPPTEAYDFDPPPDTRLLAAVASGLVRDPKTGLYIGAGIQR